MSLASRLVELAQTIGADVKSLTAQVDAATPVVIEATDTAPPVGTPAGTVVFRKQA